MDLGNFNDNPKIVLALFKNEWCHTCKQVLPIVKIVSQQYPDKIDLREIDVTQNTDLATKYEVLSLPSLIVFKNGQVIERINGFISKDNLIKKLNL